MVEFLAFKGANIHAITNNSKTLTHYVAESCSVDLIQTIVAFDGDVDGDNANGLTPLLCAIRTGVRAEAVKLLLALGCKHPFRHNATLDDDNMRQLLDTHSQLLVKLNRFVSNIL